MRAEIEEQLRADMERAKAKYVAAKDQEQRALEVFQDSRPGSADGDFAVRHATAADARARQGYAVALTESCRFSIHGEVPARLKYALDRLAGARRGRE